MTVSERGAVVAFAAFASRKSNSLRDHGLFRNRELWTRFCIEPTEHIQSTNSERNISVFQRGASTLFPILHVSQDLKFRRLATFGFTQILGRKMDRRSDLCVISIHSDHQVRNGC